VDYPVGWAQSPLQAHGQQRNRYVLPQMIITPGRLGPLAPPAWSPLRSLPPTDC